MNGVRSTFMRRGYLLTALAALLLLAASTGTAEAQSIGFTESSGSIKEDAELDIDALNGPQVITVRVDGITSANQSRVQTALGNVTVQGSGVTIGMIGADGNVLSAPAAGPSVAIPATTFSATNSDAVLVVVKDHDANAETDGARDDNWVNETIQVKLNSDGTVRLGDNIFNLTIEDKDMAPVVKFDTPSFSLNEGNERMVSLDIGGATRIDRIPPGAAIEKSVVVRVSNHDMVMVGACPGPGPTFGRYAIAITDSTGWDTDDLESTGLLKTSEDSHQIDDLANLAGNGTEPTNASMTIEACADSSGIRDRQVTLTILDRNLTDPMPQGRVTRGHIAKGAPLTITVNSDEAAPTLSFSPTDVTIDEGDSVSTRLIADGQHATEVGMVKLMVEGDAMVDLYHEDTLLEEMDGYVMVDMGMSNSARLTAMSMESRELQDGDMAYKAWKLVDGSTDVNIGDDSWFRVDVRGSTAVPALPLIGQLLLALFLMAGGSKLYRRRRG